MTAPSHTSSPPAPPTADSQDATQLCVLFSTIDRAHADAFATKACEARLVACVNQLPGVRSTYWWEGKLQHDEEVALWMEAPRADAEERIAALAELHPYDTPKIVALEVGPAHAAFTAWCVAQTRPPAGSSSLSS